MDMKPKDVYTVREASVPRNKHTKLNDPPIRESIVEIRFVAADNCTTDSFLSEASIKEGFPIREEIFRHEAKISLTAGKKPITKTVAEATPYGWKLTSDDGLWILQVKSDRISLSFVRSTKNPYPGWSSFSSKVMGIWSLASASLSVVSVSRVGLRYINQLSTLPIAETLNSKSDDGGPLLSTFHKVASEQPAEMMSTVARSSLKFDDELFANVHQLWQNADDSSANLIFDIDAYFVGEGSEIEPILNKLRVVKNSIFFESFAPEVINEFKNE